MSRMATSEYIGAKRRAYAQACRAKRKRILDEVCETTGGRIRDAGRASAESTSTGACAGAFARYGASRRHTARPSTPAETSLPSRLVLPWRFAPPLRGRQDFTAKGRATASTTRA